MFVARNTHWHCIDNVICWRNNNKVCDKSIGIFWRILMSLKKWNTFMVRPSKSIIHEFYQNIAAQIYIFNSFTFKCGMLCVHIAKLSSANSKKCVSDSVCLCIFVIQIVFFVELRYENFHKNIRFPNYKRAQTVCSARKLRIIPLTFSSVYARSYMSLCWFSFASDLPLNRIFRVSGYY